MCIEEVTAYRVKGKLHATELEAVQAAIKGIGEDITKNHHANIGQGIIQHADVLLDMLGRHKRLAPTATATIVDAESDAGEPKGGPNGQS